HVLGGRLQPTATWGNTPPTLIRRLRARDTSRGRRHERGGPGESRVAAGSGRVKRGVARGVAPRAPRPEAPGPPRWPRRIRRRCPRARAARPARRRTPRRRTVPAAGHVAPPSALVA